MSRVIHRIYVSLVGDMLWRTLDMLWRTTCTCCGLHTCVPQHIFFMLSTTCVPQYIPRVSSTTHVPCSPQHIICAPQPKNIAPKWPPQDNQNNLRYVVRVSITEHVVDNVLYVVDICCGVQAHVVERIDCGWRYVVDTTHILWRYVVDNAHSSYMLWVKICCGWRYFSVVHNMCWCSPHHTYVVEICCGVQRVLTMM